MSSGLSLSLLIGCCLGLLSLPQFAQAVTPAATVVVPLASNKAITIQLTQQKVVLVKGAETMVDASAVLPGDVIEYQATYTNNSSKSVSGLRGDLPIPDGLEYVPNSAKPGAPAAKAAMKDGVYGTEPLMHKVGAKLLPVDYAQYHALRWSLGQLAPGAHVIVSARAKVGTTP